MHALHPRSRSTSTLFTTTLAISFLVVALPHLLPCPVDRRQFADSARDLNGKTLKRKKRDASNEGSSGTTAMEADDAGARRRECPVPKPGGMVGQIMGFEQKVKERPREVIVQSRKSASQIAGSDSDAP